MRPDYGPDGFHRRRQRNELLSGLLDLAGEGFGCILVLMLAGLPCGPMIYGWLIAPSHSEIDGFVSVVDIGDGGSMENDPIKKLDGRVRDLGALSIMSMLLSGFSLICCFYFVQKVGDKDWNAVQTALTLFETFIVVSLATGFWMVRREAASRAEDIAREVAQSCAEMEARNLAAEMIPPQAFRQIQQIVAELGGMNELDEDEIAAIMAALDGPDG